MARDETLNPYVSVIVPTRNRADLLPGLLAALDAQAYPQREIIVVDDASTDGTGALLDAWAGDGRMVAHLEENRGSYAARNAGLEMARGEIIAFTDDDCLPAPEWLAELVAALGDGAAGAQGMTLAEPGAITPFTHQIEQTRGGPPYRTCNIAYRRATLDRIGPFEEMGWYADNILGHRVRRLGEIRFAPRAVVRHPPRPRTWRSREEWRRRFAADMRHRTALRELGGERVSPPAPLLPLILWIVRPLLKQSLAHLRYLVRRPRSYIRQMGPLLREKGELLAALRAGPAHPALPLLDPDLLVSVVIVTRHRPALLRQALAAVERQSWQHREIVVVDNAGTLPAPEGVRLVRAPGVGLGEARRLGVEAARGEIIAFTDDDCRPDPGWIDALIAAFRSGAAGVQGKTVAARGTPGSHAVQVLHRDLLAQTCNMAYRRDALEKAGGVDPAFQRWFEDTALAARVLRQGEIVFAPEAVVVHQARERRPLTREDWRLLVADERRLARLYPAFYRRVRGPAVLPVIMARWLVGAPIKSLLSALRDGASLSDLARLAHLLISERRDLLAELLGR
ncbi:MAG TPA: glycosyltransferase family 2 protein [Chloroflexota bacterium]|nr:glycosyltransferase family 2 protein [Chloroflexota bacterium]